MGFVQDMFSENSNVSAMRVMSFISLLFGGAIAVVGIYQGRDLSQLSTLVGVFVGGAFGGKMVQKFAEVKEVVTKE